MTYHHLKKISFYYKSIDQIWIKDKLESFVKDLPFLELHAHPKKINLDIFLIELLKFYTFYLDLLTVLGVSGAFSIVNKGDNEGFYSIGNSIDIIKTISLVYDFIEDEYIHNSIDEFIKIFENSIEKELVVVILYKPIPENENNNIRLSLGNINHNVLKMRQKSIIKKI